MRTCLSCEVEKPFSEFDASVGKNGILYHRRKCKNCRKEYLDSWYEKYVSSGRRREYNRKQYTQFKASLEANPEKKEAFRVDMNERQRNRNAKIKDLCYKAYGGYRCACCGETERLFLSMDHIDNNGYQLRKDKIHGSGHGFIAWLWKNGFPPGFQVLCMNCQHGKSRNHGVCPHKKGVTTIPQGSSLEAQAKRAAS